jgi:predicted RND superfamily exporter protein
MGWNSDTSVAYASWLIRWRWLVIALSLAMGLLATSGAQFLTLSTNYRMFFDKDNPQRQAFDAIQAIYTRNDNILITLKPDGGDVFTPEMLQIVVDLTEGAWKIPYSIRVDSITNFQHTHADGDDLVVEDLVANPVPAGRADLARIRSIALAEPLLVDRLIASGGATTGVNVTVQLPEQSESETPEAMAYARKLADQIRAEHPDVHVAITGILALSNTFREASIQDVTLLVPMMYGLITIAMVVLLRSLSGTVAILIVIALAGGTAMGLAGWLGIELSPPTTMAPTIIVTLAVADSIHIIASIFKEMSRGRGREEALVESIRINVQPVFLTSLTTVIGFLSLNFSDAPPFRDLGNITSMGIVAAWVYAMVLLPALMAVLPLRRRPSAAEPGRFSIERLAEFVVTRRRALLPGMTVVVLLLAAIIPRIELNEQFVEYFGPSIPFRADTDFTNEHLTGIYQLQYSLGAGESGDISEPAYFENLEKFAAWFAEQPGIVHISSITNTMKRLNKNMHGDDPAWYRIPDNRELGAQYLLLYEMSLPYGLDLNNQVNVDKSATRFTVTTESLSTAEFRELKERSEAWLVNNTPPAMHGEGTGTTVVFTYLTYRNMWSMIIGTFLALVVICACLCIAFRSLRIGLLSMVPNMVPPIMAFGVWAIVVGRVGLAASFVTAIALGIIVDDTVHFLSKYLRARREQNLSAEDAVRYAFSTVGSALVITSVILAAGFFVLSFSAFELNAVQGQLTAIMIVMALLADFLLLPPLLMAIERRHDDEGCSVPAEAA